MAYVGYSPVLGQYRKMDALDWRWATVNGGTSTPDIDDLRASAKRLLQGAAECSFLDI